MSYEVVRLGDVATYHNGKAFKPSEWETEGKKIIRIQNLNDSTKEYNYSNKSFEDKYLVKKGDILIAWSASLGVYQWDKEDSWLNQHIFKVEFNKKEVDKRYFVHCISSILEEMEKQIHGATMKHITKEKFEKIEVPLPPLDIQKKIADTLDKAQELIDKRKEQISALDKFLENLFLDMFGDPVSNSMGWEVKELKSIIEKLEAGKSLAGEIEIDNKVLNTGCISKKFFNKFDYKYLPEEYVPNENHLVSAGDLLISRMNTEELVGVCGYVFDVLENTYIPDRLWKVVLKDKKISLIFLWFAFKNKSFKIKISNISTGTSGSMKNISKEKFLGLNCILPPLDLQNQFASIVKKVEAEKTKLEASLKEMEDNFNSIMQRAFKGELF